MLVFDVAGVGYELLTPAGTAGKLKPDAHGRCTVFVHTHLRSDALELYGFAHEAERELFRLLINVPNVGPRTALNVLGALPVVDLITAVSSGDLKRLHQVPGIGKKTAERLVLELKEKLLSLQPGQVEVGAAKSDTRSRLVTALTNMGYRTAEAERAVKHLGARVEGEPIGTLLREALQLLST
jgi:holliday junction DNA helicase RuvA